MNRRSFLSRLVGCVVAASLTIRLKQPEELPIKRSGPIFGLLSTENLDAYWSRSVRRKVFYEYPTSVGPLENLFLYLPHD